MSFFEGLSEKTMEDFGNINEAEKNDFEIYMENNDFSGMLLGMIHELKAFNHLIARLEYELDHTRMEYECDLLRLKNSSEYVEKYKTLKQREEMALLECRESHDMIVELEHELRILKANKQGLEYEIRFMFKQMDLEIRYGQGNCEDGDCTCGGGTV